MNKKNRPWEVFFQEKVREIFENSKVVLDIGEGLRARQGRGNRFDPKRAWIAEYFHNVDYKVLDPVPDYNPDIVGDIHALPMPENSVESIFCLATLEHVQNPFLAVNELRRVLVPGGRLLLYVPFLFYYHAEQGYYKDYWRFTKDGVDRLFSDFASLEKSYVRGPLETWLNLIVPGKFGLLKDVAFLLDDKFKKNSAQVSGYYIFCRK